MDSGLDCLSIAIHTDRLLSTNESAADSRGADPPIERNRASVGPRMGKPNLRSCVYHNTLEDIRCERERHSSGFGARVQREGYLRSCKTGVIISKIAYLEFGTLPFRSQRLTERLRYKANHRSPMQQDSDL